MEYLLHLCRIFNLHRYQPKVMPFKYEQNVADMADISFSFCISAVIMPPISCLLPAAKLSGSYHQAVAMTLKNIEELPPLFMNSRFQ